MKSVNLWGCTTAEKLIKLEEAVNELNEQLNYLNKWGAWVSTETYLPSKVFYDVSKITTDAKGLQTGHTVLFINSQMEAIVNIVSGNQFTISNATSTRGTNGTDGKDSLSYNGIYSFSGVPTTSSTYSLPSNFFNRNPQVGEKFELFVRNTLTGNVYMTIAVIQSTPSGNIVCFNEANTQPIMLTGEGFNWRGEWTSTPSSDIYERDVFSYEGSSYIAQTNNPSTPPTINGDWGYLAKGATTKIIYNHHIIIRNNTQDIFFNIINDDPNSYEGSLKYNEIKNVMPNDYMFVASGIISTSSGTLAVVGVMHETGNLYAYTNAVETIEAQIIIPEDQWLIIDNIAEIIL